MCRNDLMASVTGNRGHSVDMLRVVVGWVIKHWDRSLANHFITRDVALPRNVKIALCGSRYVFTQQFAFLLFIHMQKGID